MERMDYSFAELSGELVTLPASSLLEMGVKGRRTEFVTLGDIHFEEVPINRAHANRLATSILQPGVGQLSEITLAPRLIDGAAQFLIIDGFHRTGAMRLRALNGAGELWGFQWRASTRYGCTDPELAEFRILASTHASVEADRMAEWIVGYYKNTEWAQNGIPAHVAFMAASQKGTVLSKEHNLTQEDAARLIEWAREKSEYWNKPPNSIAGVLRIAEDGDPELVRMIRSGNVADDEILQSKLAMVTLYFPGEKNYGNQRAILQYAREYGLSAQQIEAVILMVHDKLKPGMDAVDAFNSIRSVNFFRPIVVQPFTDRRKNGIFPVLWRVDNSDSRKTPSSSKDEDYSTIPVPDLIKMINKLQREKASLELTVSKQSKEMDLLRGELDTIKASLPWWRQDVPGISPVEGAVAKLYFEDGMEEDQIAEAIGSIPSYLIGRLLSSGRAKFLANKRVKEITSSSN